MIADRQQLLCCELCGHAGRDVAAIAFPGGAQTRCVDFLACWRRYTGDAGPPADTQRDKE